MKAIVALIRREFIEHRGPFLVAPAVLLGIFTAGMLGAITTRGSLLPLDAPWGIRSAATLRGFELGMLGGGAFWFAYLLGVLFFYCADAFNADRRNNAMLFWKSMPVSDFGVLASKFTAVLTLFPAIIFGFFLLTGVVLFGLLLVGAAVIPNFVLASPGMIFSSFVQVALFGILYLVLGVLWYAPFFAWVAGLSTLFGRWSIPLAFLIPTTLGALESIFFGTSTNIGHLLQFISERGKFGQQDLLLQAVVSPVPMNAGVYATSLVAAIDWMQMLWGFLFSVVVLYIASERRRRSVAA